ncbi:MAG: hypothetical protein ISN29_11895 [Gammaproteobacteria bacterium AqS3]|nr:hypothetical protein [Gammaproteobacteria bacterium AqS3]
MTGSKYRLAEICTVLLLTMLAGCWSGGNENKSGSYIDALEKFAEENSTGSANKGVVWGGLCDFRFQHLAQTDVNEQMKWDKEPFTLSEFRINCKLVSKEGYPYHEAMQQETEENSEIESVLHYLRVCAHRKAASSKKDLSEKICNHMVVDEVMTSVGMASFFSAIFQPSILVMTANEMNSRYWRRMNEQEFNEVLAKSLEELAKEAINLAEASYYDGIYQRTLIQANLKWGEKESVPKKN